MPPEVLQKRGSPNLLRESVPQSGDHDGKGQGSGRGQVGGSLETTTGTQEHREGDDPSNMWATSYEGL